ncbi:hypothetical protein H7X65_03095 [Candidatus Parcubacteria bacterium]|nr:hypothetical protein [Candidatus Parcubacteria bacterium]
MKKISSNKPGYHIDVIKKGEVGKSSKILEEVMELIDAEKQECKIMILVELSDTIGAIEYYLQKNNFGVGIADLKKMSDITKRAFINGHRK